MIQTQSFEIQPNGIVKYGAADYSANLETGVVTYFAEIVVGFWFIKKTYTKTGSIVFPPEYFNKSYWANNNSLVVISGITFNHLYSPSSNKMLVESTTSDFSGKSTVSFPNDRAFINTLTSTAHINGVDLEINLVPTNDMSKKLKFVLGWDSKSAASHFKRALDFLRLWV